MSTFSNSDVEARTWNDLCTKTGQTLHLEPGAKAEVYRWVYEDDGAVTLVPVAEIDDPFLVLVAKPAPPAPKEPPKGASPTEAAPAADPKE